MAPTPSRSGLSTPARSEHKISGGGILCPTNFWVSLMFGSRRPSSCQKHCGKDTPCIPILHLWYEPNQSIVLPGTGPTGHRPRLASEHAHDYSPHPWHVPPRPPSFSADDHTALSVRARQPTRSAPATARRREESLSGMRIPRSSLRRRPTQSPAVAQGRAAEAGDMRLPLT